MRTFVKAFLVVALFSHCLVSLAENKIEDQGNLFVLEATVEYLDSDEQSLPIEHFPSNIVLWFPYIAGSIFGNPDSETYFYIRLNGASSFSYDLLQVEEDVKQYASTLSQEYSSLGLSVEPEGASLARIGTFALDGNTGKDIGWGYGFKEPHDHSDMVLIYVDQPCSIGGEFELGGQSYSHDIDIESAGFHWLIIEKHGPDRKVLKTYKGASKPVFYIYVKNIKST